LYGLGTSCNWGVVVQGGTNNSISGDTFDCEGSGGAQIALTQSAAHTLIDKNTTTTALNSANKWIYDDGSVTPVYEGINAVQPSMTNTLNGASLLAPVYCTTFTGGSPSGCAPLAPGQP
jgi:hypothetical protein